jgi:rhodanese-related sulfurtransferase
MSFLSILSLLLLAIPPISPAMEVGTITKEELKAQLDNPEIILLDVRTGKNWKSSEFKIKGAVRANPNDFDKWSGTYPKDKKFVLYCA